MLEHYAVRMAKKQQIHRFLQRLHLDFQPIVVQKQDAEVLRYDEPAQFRSLPEERLYDCLLQTVCPKFLDYPVCF